MGLNMTDAISHNMNKLARTNNMAYSAEIWKMVEKGLNYILRKYLIFISKHNLIK